MKKQRSSSSNDVCKNLDGKLIGNNDYVCSYSEFCDTPSDANCYSNVKDLSMDTINQKSLQHWRSITDDSGFCDTTLGSLSAASDHFSSVCSQEPDTLASKKCLLEEFDMDPMSLSPAPVSSRLRSSNLPEVEKQRSRLSLDSYQSHRKALLQSDHMQQTRDRSKLRLSVGDCHLSKYKRRSSGVSVLMTACTLENLELSRSSAGVQYSKTRRKCRRSLDLSSSSTSSDRKPLCKVDEDKVYMDTSRALKSDDDVDPSYHVQQTSPEQRIKYIEVFATPSRRMRFSNYIRPKTPKKVSVSNDDVVQDYSNPLESPIKRTPSKSNGIVPRHISLSPCEDYSVLLRTTSQSTPVPRSRTPHGSLSPNEWIRASPGCSVESAVALASCTRKLNMGCSDLPQQSASDSLNATSTQADMTLFESMKDSLMPLDEYSIDADSGFISYNLSCTPAGGRQSSAGNRIGAVPCVLDAEELHPESKKYSVEYNTRSAAKYRESLKLVGNKALVSYPHHVIGPRMESEFVDIIFELKRQGVTGVLSTIFSLLQPKDLIRVQSVSRAWRDAALSDRTTQTRIDAFRKVYENPSVKENPVHGVKSRKPRMTETKRLLADVQLAEPEPDSPTSKMKTRSASNAEKFWQEASKLNRTGECLMKCPRCQKPAAKDCAQERGRCSNAQCRFDFCTKCLLSHPTSLCTVEMGRRLRSDCAVGSKKSKQNLRRL